MPCLIMSVNAFSACDSAHDSRFIQHVQAVNLPEIADGAESQCKNVSDPESRGTHGRHDKIRASEDETAQEADAAVGDDADFHDDGRAVVPAQNAGRGGLGGVKQLIGGAEEHECAGEAGNMRI